MIWSPERELSEREPLERELSEREQSERGSFAIFIAVIVVAMLLFGGLAFDAPRLISARQHAAHTAGEAARIASSTVAAGGTLTQAREVASKFVADTPPLYGAQTVAGGIVCVGTRVEVTVYSSYVNRSALAVFRRRMPVSATASAEAVLKGPDGSDSPLSLLPECPLFAAQP